MSAQNIYKILTGAGMTPTGAAAMLGNMQAESGLRANNAQDGMTPLSDADYTAKVDNGLYTNFNRDAVGYGLCQWTYWTRKQALLVYAKSKGVSIGDETMQVNFCIKELTADYSSLWKYLCTTGDLYEATSRICKEYERPAVNNIDTRYKAAQKHYAAFSGGVVETPKEETKTQPQAASFTLTLRILKKGMTGEDVRTWQYILKGKGFDCGTADGSFGPKTDAATKAYQRSIRFDPDGSVGPATLGYAFGTDAK